MTYVSIANPTTGGTAQPAPHIEPIIDLTEGEDDPGCKVGEVNAPGDADEQEAPVPVVQVAPEGLQASLPHPDVVQIAEATQAPVPQTGVTTGGCRPRAPKSPLAPEKASRWPRLELG